MSIDSAELTLGEVFITHRAQLRRLVRSIVHASDLVDDVMQDAYLRLAALSNARQVREPFCYCCQVVRNLAFDHFRRQSVEATYRSFGEDVEALEVPASGPLPERMLSERQSLKVVDDALSTLAPRTRKAFELHRLSGMTQRDIGLQLGCSATLVNFMIRDADQALQGCRHLLFGND